MRCPVCKAENSSGPACRRCKADLGVLYSLEETRARYLARARSTAELGDWESSIVAARWADHLRRDATTCRLLALAYLMLGQPAEVHNWCRRWQQLQGT